MYKFTSLYQYDHVPVCLHLLQHKTPEILNNQLSLKLSPKKKLAVIFHKYTNYTIYTDLNYP